MKLKLPKRTRTSGTLFRVAFMFVVGFSMQWALFKVAAPAGCSWSFMGYGETCAGVPYLLSLVYVIGLTALAAIWCIKVDDWWDKRTNNKDDEPTPPSDPAADLRQKWKRNLDD